MGISKISLTNNFCLQLFSSIPEQHPLKQGLKRKSLSPSSCLSFWVEEQHPLKQGLKLQFLRGLAIQRQVEEQHPLKQG